MKRFPVAFFFERLSWTEEIHANWSRKKRSCLRQWADLFQFSKFRNVQTQSNILKIFTFVSQRRLLELLSYGECNHLYISDTCFLKTTHLSVIVFGHSFFFLISKKKSAYIIFLKLKNIDYSNVVLKTLTNIKLNNFSLRGSCCEINFEKRKSLKIARSFCAKVFFKDHLQVY